MLVLPAALLGAASFYFWLVVAWGEYGTVGAKYFGRTPPQRKRYRRWLASQRALLWPLLWILPRILPFRFASASFRVRGLAVPKGTCSPHSMARAADFQPLPGDVLIVTPMRCGTTWMQQLVYEVLTRGQQDLAATGRTLAMVSPWLESVRGVSLANAPRIGHAPPRRIIKTHLPAEWLPVSTAATYVYVVRHPVSCFASCVSFLNLNLQQFAPRLEDMETWFCSPQSMWWGTWPSHVRLWWARAQQHDNVHCFFYEELKRGLPAAIAQLADALAVCPLTPGELSCVLEHAGFGWMQTHAESFEIQPPHLLQPRPTCFVSGRLNRYEDVPADMALRILDWCQEELADIRFPWERFAGGDGGRREASSPVR